jgi:hypothetical protein
MSRFSSDNTKISRQSSHPSDEHLHRLLLDAHNVAALHHKLALIDIEGEHRLALYRSHFNPNQPRVPAGHPDGGQWTPEGAVPVGSGHSGSEKPSPSVWSGHFKIDPDSDTGVPEVQQASAHPKFNDWRTGISTIDDTTQALMDILDRTVTPMSRAGMSPSRWGVLVHVTFATQVKLAGLPGIAPDDVETTFSLIPGARYGSKDSIRTDVVLRNAIGDIIAIYDVKTGDADLDERRVNELLAKTRAAPGTPVIQLHLTHGPSRKAEQVGPNLPAQMASLRLNVRRLQ